jgi:dimethylglycine oxidase
MKDRARLVIIGAGIVGCSTAYWLARLGWSDVLVVDAGPLPRTGGSTSHAPGGMHAVNPSRLMTRLAMQTRELFGELSWQDRPCFKRVGGLELATSAARWHDLHRKQGLARAYGVEANLLSPQETKRLSPLLDESKILGAFYTPDDGIVQAVDACAAMADFATKAGLRFAGGTEVTGIETAGGKVAAVLTSRGRIACEAVLCAAGIWGPLIGKMAGIPMPLQPCQHLYARTAPIPELAGETRDAVHPLVRHQDASMYLRQHADRYGIGSYRHEPLPVEPEQIRKHADADGMPSVTSFTPEHFEEAARAVRELFPAIGRAQLAESINGLFSFTPDGFPILGPSLEIRGFWAGEAVWITHAGGAGKALAHWLVEGDPGLDVHEADVNRFHKHQTTPAYVRRRSTQQYREVYDIIHPLRQMDEPRGLRRTPFHQRFETMGAAFFESAGWERPQWLESNAGLLDRNDLFGRDIWAARNWSPIQGAEHRHVREHVALFDLTPFTKIEVKGPGAAAFLQRLACNDVDRPPGRVVYTAMLNRHAGIMCDLTVTRLAPERFLVVTAGAIGMHDLAWIRRNAPDDGSVEVADVSTAWCTLGLWGPKARAVLQAVTGEDVGNGALPYFGAKEITIGYVPALALRVSYVGEQGFEIYAPSECGLELWDRLWQAGQEHQMIAAGAGAVDSLRLEKGYRLWGADIDPETNPFEAGLGRLVRLSKGDFIGREAAERISSQGPRRRLSCMTLDEPEVALVGKEPIVVDGKATGFVTSTNYGYSIGRQIAYGYLPSEQAKEGGKVEIEWFGSRHPATIVREPLFDPRGMRLRA